MLSIWIYEETTEPTFYRISKLALTPGIGTTRATGEVQSSDSDQGPWTKVDGFDEQVTTTDDPEKMKEDISNIAIEISLKDIATVKVVGQVITDLDDQIFSTIP